MINIVLFYQNRYNLSSLYLLKHQWVFSSLHFGSHVECEIFHHLYEVSPYNHILYVPSSYACLVIFHSRSNGDHRSPLSGFSGFSGFFSKWKTWKNLKNLKKTWKEKKKKYFWRSSNDFCPRKRYKKGVIVLTITNKFSNIFKLKTGLYLRVIQGYFIEIMVFFIMEEGWLLTKYLDKFYKKICCCFLCMFPKI